MMMHLAMASYSIEVCKLNSQPLGREPMDTPETQQIFDLRRTPESLHPRTITRQGNSAQTASRPVSSIDVQRGMDPAWHAS
jgi:hypothetical protein